MTWFCAVATIWRCSRSRIKLLVHVVGENRVVAKCSNFVPRRWPTAKGRLRFPPRQDRQA